MSASSVASVDQLYPKSVAARRGDLLLPGELGLIARGITLRTGAETALLAAFNATDRQVQIVSAWGAASRKDMAPITLVSGGFVDRVLESGHTSAEPIDPEHDQTLGVAGSGTPITYAIGAGVRPPGGPPGALCVGLAARPSDPALTLWQVESYARLASLCLHEAGVLDGLMAVAHVDGLTGCLNYGAVRAELDREISRSERHGRTLSCCFIDLDHFKSVNDNYGHLHGNRVLAQIANILREGVRAGDTIGRYGGDEFLAILPDANEAEACAMGERLRSKIFTTRPRGTNERLDASMGVAQWRSGTTADDMLGAADAALLRAKDGGGGIVVGAGCVVARARSEATKWSA